MAKPLCSPIPGGTEWETRTLPKVGSPVPESCGSPVYMIDTDYLVEKFDQDLVRKFEETKPSVEDDLAEKSF